MSKFADKKYPYSIMRAIRKGLEDKIDLVPYADKGYSGKALLEVAKGKSLDMTFQNIWRKDTMEASFTR